MSELHAWMLWAFAFGLSLGALVMMEVGWKRWRFNVKKLQRSDRQLRADLDKLNQDICSACKDVCP